MTLEADTIAGRRGIATSTGRCGSRPCPAAIDVFAAALRLSNALHVLLPTSKDDAVKYLAIGLINPL